MSFQQPFPTFLSCELPCTRVPVIAPAWIDLEINEFNALYYRTTQDKATLNQVQQMVTNINPRLRDYQPTYAVIITWFEAMSISQPLVRTLCHSRVNETSLVTLCT